MPIYSSSLIPPLTTNNTVINGVTYTVVVSTKYSTTYDGFKAFDGTLNSDTSYWMSANPDVNKYIQIQVSNPIKVNRYVIFTPSTNTTYLGRMPKSWTFLGSNDGVNWITLDTRTNVTDWVLNSSKTFDFSNNNKYSYYRISISESNDATYVNIPEIQFFEVLYVNKILIQLNDGDYISVENGGYTNDLVPKLTSNTDVLYSSNFNSTGFEAYKAFDDDGTTGVQTNSGANPNGLYIGYDFKIKVKISAYRLKCRGTSTTRMIKKWDFQGSNDGVVWNTIDSRSNVTDWVADTFKTFDLPQQVEYKMYRIYVYENNGDASYTSIGEIEFIDKNSNIVKLLTSLTEQDIIDYGMDKSTVLDLSQTMSRKSFVEKNTTTLGSGKVFSKSIDTTKLLIKKLTIK